MRKCRSLFLLTVGIANLAYGADWARFRGPNGSAVSEMRKLPVVFGPTTNLAWRTDAPKGTSSPIVSGNRVFLTGYDGTRLLTRCVSLQTGDLIWERSLEAARTERKSPPNDAASSTPVASERAVHVLFSGFGLVTYALDGREQWRRSLGPFTQPHGMANSPVLADSLLIIVADQVSDSYIAAFDAMTGEQKWRTPRANFVGGYSTPLLRRNEVIVAGPAELVAYSIQRGERTWSVPRMGIMPIGSPVCIGDRIFVNNDAVPPFESLANQFKSDRNGDGKITPEEFPDPSFKEAVLAIDRAYGNGDGAVDKDEWDGALRLMRTLNALVAINVNDPKELWRNTKKLADAASPIVYQGVLYLVRDGGILTSVDPDTGGILRQERIPGMQGRIFASPVAAAGKLCILSESGKAAIIKAGRNWELLTVNDLAERCYATPALVDGMLLIRTEHSLFAFSSSR